MASIGKQIDIHPHPLITNMLNDNDKYSFHITEMNLKS